MMEIEVSNRRGAVESLLDCGNSDPSSVQVAVPGGFQLAET